MENYLNNKKVMNKRVVSVLGIEVINANFNSDFNKLPRQTPTGQYISSRESMGHCGKHFLHTTGERVFSYKMYREVETKNGIELIPMNIEEKYNYLFPSKDGDKKPTNLDVLKNLFTLTDVRNFGVCYPVKGCQVSTHGVAQLTMGINKNPETTTTVMQILSPFLNDPKDKNTSVGSKVILDEAHFFYTLTVNPFNLKDYKKHVGEYMEKDYLKLKESLMKGVTWLDTGNKAGCYNEFGIFVTFKEGSTKTIPKMSSLIKYTCVEDEKNIIDFAALNEKLEILKEEIEDIEIIYNTDSIELKNIPQNARLVDIVTV